MKIVLFHPTLLPARNYGGVERVVLWLARGLVELGHEVWVGALQGSQMPAGVNLIEMDPKLKSAWALFEKLPAGVDLIHFMAPPEPRVFENLPCAGILTVHGNGKPGEIFPENTVFLSADHARRHGSKCFVHNGIDPSEVECTPDQKDDYFLFLSKTSWRVKNLRGAMRLCSQAQAKLRIAGGNRPLWPRLRAAVDPRMQWLGPVGGARKAWALSRSKALVFPVLWDEPFGLVVVEALMSGTPVIASPRGSIPELVSTEVGATPQSEAEWVEWLSMGKLPWKPERCREWAIEHFHYRRMSESYLTLYQKLLAGKKLTDPAGPAAT